MCRIATIFEKAIDASPFGPARDTARAAYARHTHTCANQVCAETASDDDASEAAYYAEQAIERYLEGGWDLTGRYAAESFAEGPYALA